MHKFMAIMFFSIFSVSASDQSRYVNTPGAEPRSSVSAYNHTSSLADHGSLTAAVESSDYAEEADLDNDPLAIDDESTETHIPRMTHLHPYFQPELTNESLHEVTAEQFVRFLCQELDIKVRFRRRILSSVEHIDASLRRRFVKFLSGVRSQHMDCREQIDIIDCVAHCFPDAWSPLYKAFHALKPTNFRSGEAYDLLLQLSESPVAWVDFDNAISFAQRVITPHLPLNIKLNYFNIYPALSMDHVDFIEAFERKLSCNFSALRDQEIFAQLAEKVTFSNHVAVFSFLKRVGFKSKNKNLIFNFLNLDDTQQRWVNESYVRQPPYPRQFRTLREEKEIKKSVQSRLIQVMNYPINYHTRHRVLLNMVSYIDMHCKNNLLQYILSAFSEEMDLSSFYNNILPRLPQGVHHFSRCQTLLTIIMNHTDTSFDGFQDILEQRLNTYMQLLERYRHNYQRIINLDIWICEAFHSIFQNRQPSTPIIYVWQAHQEAASFQLRQQLVGAYESLFDDPYTATMITSALPAPDSELGVFKECSDQFLAFLHTNLHQLHKAATQLQRKGVLNRFDNRNLEEFLTKHFRLNNAMRGIMLLRDDVDESGHEIEHHAINRTKDYGNYKIATLPNARQLFVLNYRLSCDESDKKHFTQNWIAETFSNPHHFAHLQNFFSKATTLPNNTRELLAGHINIGGYLSSNDNRLMHLYTDDITNIPFKKIYCRAWVEAKMNHYIDLIEACFLVMRGHNRNIIRRTDANKPACAEGAYAALLKAVISRFKDNIEAQERIAELTVVNCGGDELGIEV